MIIQHVSQHEFWMYLMLMLHNKGTKSRKLCLNYLKITKVCRFKRTIKCISNVIYIVNNIVTSFYPSISFRAKGCTKIYRYDFHLFSKIAQHLRTYDDKDNIPLSLQLIINQKSKYYSLFNLIKVRPKQKNFKKKLRDENFENIYHMILEASASFSVLPQDLNLASMEQFYKVFGPNSITNEQQTDKRAAPGPQEYLWHTNFTELQYFGQNNCPNKPKACIHPLYFQAWIWAYRWCLWANGIRRYEEVSRKYSVISTAYYIYIIAVKNWNCHILDSDSTIGSI